MATRLLKHPLVWMLMSVILARCEPIATPVAAVLPPTATSFIVPTLPPPIRYAFTLNTAGFVPDLDLIRQTGLVDQLGDDGMNLALTAGYDVVIGYGVYEGWQRSPITPTVALLINPNLAPLNDPVIASWVRRSLDPQSIVETLGIPGIEAFTTNPASTTEVRTALANLGYPDGILLTLVHDATLLGADRIGQSLSAYNLELEQRFATSATVLDILVQNRVHLALIAWTSLPERDALLAQFGESSLINLYTLPISYRLSAEVEIGFMPYGFPVARR